MDDFAVDRVLIAVEQIPPGRVASYGDIGRIVGLGPRQVGSVLSRYGSGVPWWRVVNSYGDPGGSLLARARPHWHDEEITVKPNGRGCRIRDFRADLAIVDHAYRAALDVVLAVTGTPLPNVGRPATGAFAVAGITTLEHTLGWSRSELLALHGVGPKAVRILEDALVAQGWALRAGQGLTAD